MNIRKIFLTAAIVAALAIPMLAAPVHAAKKNVIGKTFLVNSTADEVDANIGDGKCKSASKKCTLRAAIQESNMLLGPNTILLPAGEYIIAKTGPDTPTTGDMGITDDLTIRGQGIFQTVINGDASYRIFNIVELNGQVNVTLEHLTLRNGQVGGLNPDGGAIRNGGNLTLDHVLISGSGAKSGGGISNAKTLHVRYSTLMENSAARGGGLANGSSATANFFASTILDNQATYGGGVDNSGGTVFMVNSTIASNRALIDGGGVYNLMQSGKSNYLDLRSVTVSRNAADWDVNGSGNGGGVYNQTGATVIVFDTILAQNVDMSTEINPALLQHDCTGALSEGDHGYNLLAVPNGCTGLVNGEKGDQVGTSNAPLQAKLNDLADNGGPTLTMLPANDSPVVNAGDPGNCSNDTNGVDQRRYARVIGNKCDIGAVEVGASCAGKPVKPVAFTPYSGQQIKKTNVALKWLDANCATTYQILVRQDSKQGTIVADIKGLGSVGYTLNGLAKGHTYFWRVKACNGTKCKAGSWSSFIIKP